jgi:heme/copper-type cytochrome/quinol oxidase subunit 2
MSYLCVEMCVTRCSFNHKRQNEPIETLVFSWFYCVTISIFLIGVLFISKWKLKPEQVSQKAQASVYDWVRMTEKITNVTDC